MRIVSDVHGNLKRYKSLAEGSPYSLQIGDLGFTYTYKKLLGDKDFDVSRHKYFAGNHDDYDFCKRGLDANTYSRFSQFNLGDYGMRSHGGLDFYVIRGAFSVDWMYRTMGLDLFANEEFELTQHDAIIEDFVKAKPDIVFSHECPQSVGYGGSRLLKGPDILVRLGYNYDTFSTKTGILLQKMFEAHQPKEWLFAHYHQNWEDTVNGTRFRCIEAEGYVDYDCSNSKPSSGSKPAASGT